MTAKQRTELIKFANSTINVYGILTKHEFYKIFRYSYPESKLTNEELMDFLTKLFKEHQVDEKKAALDQKQLFVFSEFINDQGARSENTNEVIYFAFYSNYIIQNFIYYKALNFKPQAPTKKEQQTLKTEIEKLLLEWKKNNLNIASKEDLFEYEFPTALYFSSIIEKSYFNVTQNTQYDKIKLFTATTSYYYFLMLYGLEDYTLKSFIKEITNSGANFANEEQQKTFIEVLARVAYNLPIWKNRGVNTYSLSNN